MIEDFVDQLVYFVGDFVAGSGFICQQIVDKIRRKLEKKSKQKRLENEVKSRRF